MEEVKEEKDLGVLVEDTMKPSKQCNAAAKSANFALGQIQRAFHFRKKINLVPLYKTFVRPRLEHAVSAWNPWLESDIKCLEKIQERLIRMLSDVKGDTYEEKLKDAGLTTSKERRARGDMIQTFKVLKGFNQVSKENWFQEIPENARPTRTNAVAEGGKVVKKQSVLQVERARLETRRNFFSIRAAQQWNELPEEVKNTTSINGFKNAYDRWRNNQHPIVDDDNPREERSETELT